MKVVPTPLSQWLQRQLWRPSAAREPPPLRWARALLQFLYALGRELLAGQLTLRATGLVYTTLLSAIPLLALCFSVIKVMGVHQVLQPQLEALMEPLGPRGTEITDWVVRTVDHLQGGVLGAVSLIFLLYTAIGMVQKVEESFNHVWLVPRTRNLARRLIEYLSILLITPLVAAIVVSLATSIANEAMVQQLLERQPLGGVAVASARLLPWFLVTAMFCFLYKVLPNARVGFLPAATGALAAGILWVIAGRLFAWAVTLSVGRNAVYGSFAIAVSALIWLHLNWLILLIGAQVAFYVQHPVFLRLGRSEPELDNSLREHLALNIMYLSGRAFRDGNARCTAATISAATRVPGLTLAPIIALLEGAGLLRTTADDVLIPGREPSGITLAAILAAVRDGGDTGSLLPPAWSPPVAALTTRLQDALDQLLADESLGELLGSSEPGSESEPGSGPGSIPAARITTGPA
ncbi:MAG: YihY/virulence factor BrkB family protein [Gammaproteobacteria bacterium PRO9]|nr:YihY/virulence factor BrkB family protein [Gammaproteobacteria bacterium PRO9]